jgi:two-component system NarL family sensor kinase
MEERSDSSAEIIIYPHCAGAARQYPETCSSNSGFCTIEKKGEPLNVLVVDNGRGYDSNLAENNKSAGLINIPGRVNYLKGQLAIDTQPAKGTLVNIEFSLPGNYASDKIIYHLLFFQPV